MRAASRSTVRLTVLAAGLSLAAGCAATRSAGTWPVCYPTGGASPLGRVLPAGALASVYDAGEEIPRLLRPPAAVEEAPASRVAQQTRPRRAKLRIGLRAGSLSSDGAESDWEDVESYGLFLRRVPLERSKASLELGVDYAAPETADGLVSSTIYVVRADLLVGRFGGRGATAYLLLGGHAIMEEATRNATGESMTGRGGGAEVGLGLGSRSGRWDLRGVYSLLLASENTDSNLSLSFGLAF
jgi:hypothetical protein